MDQIVYFRVKNNRTGKTAKLECKVAFVDSTLRTVTFIANEPKLKIVVGKSSSVFAQKLAAKGELTQKILIPEGMLKETILEKLQKEFGARFRISILPGSELTVAKKAVKKKVGLPPGKRAVKKAAKKAKSDEEFSNYGGKIEGKNVMYSFGQDMDYQGLGGLEMGDIEVTEEKPHLKADYDTVEVLFATDRNKTDSEDPNEKFGGERNKTNKLEFGICKISIPPDHETGQIERPSWFKRLFFSDSENPQKHVAIYDLKLKTETDFLSCLNSKINSSSSKDAFIFIHGYNVSFQEAIRRTAQLAHDLSFKGAALSYSWPSYSTVQNYMYDEDSVMWTVTHLKQFILKVINDGSLEKLHIIAHSMGNRALTNAIKELNASGVDLKKINQIILAAPDIDSNVFTDVIVPGIKNVSQQITLYASSKDKALKTSRNLRADIIRAGESGKDIVIVDGVKTIDASKVDTNFLGHGYFAETKELIQDIFLILEHSFNPEQRNLKGKEIPERGIYWLFPS